MKSSHTPTELAARASGYGLNVLDARDAPAPPGLPSAKPGYRYMNVRVRARVKKTVRTAVPWPFSIADSSRVVSLQAS